MKEQLWKTLFLFFAAMAFFCTANAKEAPYVVLEGPDVVQVGRSVTYSVSTVGGTDSSYSWWLGYVSNNAATLDNNVLTTINPGIVGIRVVGNNTGAAAQLHVQVVPNDYGGVSITGPDKVAVGGKIVLCATTGGVPGPYGYNWYEIRSSGFMVTKVNGETGEIEGVNEGTATICVVDQATGLSGEKDIEVVSAEKKPPVVSISAGLGENFMLELRLSIQGDVPADAILYIAVQFDGVLYYLPTLASSPAPFRTNPTATYYEKVLSVPITSIPYKEYTFYAAILDGSFKFLSNLDTSVISAGTR